MGRTTESGELSMDRPAKDPTIFISYRRIDTKTRVASLARDLSLKFGPDAIFLDTDKIRAGNKWQHEIEAAVEAADVLLVAIGDKWLSATDLYHRRRIDNENDWVRQEICSALRS